MTRKILLKTKGEEVNTVRFVVTEDNEPVFQGIYDTKNIYNGTLCAVRVKDRLVSCKSVFCEVGGSRTAFVKNCNFLPGKIMLVQAESAEHEKKGTRFTTDIRINGKFIILVIHQFSPKIGLEPKISKKIKDSEIKKALTDCILSYSERTGNDIDFSCEVICRTAVADLTDYSVIDDEITMLLNEFNCIYNKFSKEHLTGAKIGIVKNYENVLDYIFRHERTDDFDEVVCDSSVLSHDLSEKYPALSNKIKCMSPSNEYDIFAVYAVDGKLAQLLRKQVYLKSGAYLVVEYTEAMTVIDVNSGKNTKNTAFDINIEAAAEIMRQLRVRDLGGIIMCDFINMPDRRCEMNLVDHMKKLSDFDPCELYISEVSRLGLVEMARKRN